ncbi:H/ACA snoRNPs complex protein [Aureococcus anophagefferens]|uniref:H/ACA snoRNPs complex protein n=1 Tax=Aureococcus anophagefferens TaxID=44056 RepID=A0ABR1G4S2_AURAN
MVPVLAAAWVAAAAAHGRSCAPAAPRFDAAAACGPGVSGVVVVPAVRKGLNNQRMRIVQDAVVASLLGAALELPREEVAFGDVFDEARVVAGLRSRQRRVDRAAEAALRRFRAETRDAPVVALHWRGDEDFVRTAHGLNASRARRLGVDFELGVAATPSAGAVRVVLRARRARARAAGGAAATSMVDVDVRDGLGAIFAKQFLYGEDVEDARARARARGDLVELHGGFGAGLGACVLRRQGEEGRRVVLRAFQACDECAPVLPNVCLDTGAHDARYEALLDGWNPADELSRHDDALGVSCARAARLLDVAGGPHRDAATGASTRSTRTWRSGGDGAAPSTRFARRARAQLDRFEALAELLVRLRRRRGASAARGRRGRGAG